MHVSLYRKYRPQSFSDMVGQSAAVGVLRESLREGRLGHAHLFSGPRGCGKTSAARLVAKTLNCSNPTEAGEACGVCANCVGIALGEHLDVIEIDGASNRGIGEIRDLKSHVNLKPLNSVYKVYIIDEVHMLTEPAFNALLKTLEEPPASVVFMLATTEPHKVPVTIRSRCQHIPFHRIAITDMIARLTYVTEQEKIEAEPEAIWEIARQADGALRDALSLLEQSVTLGKGRLTLESVSSLMGGSNKTALEKWVTNLRQDPAQAKADLDKMLARGISLERLTESIFVIFRDIWLYLLWGERSVEVIENSESELAFLREESRYWEASKAKGICAFLSRLLPRTRYGMRLEVFSGLVMLESLNIIEGVAQAELRAPDNGVKPQPVQSQPVMPQRPSQPHPRSRQAEQELPEMPVWDDGFDDLTVENDTAQKAKAEAAARKTAAPSPESEIKVTENLEDNDFSKLLTAIGNKALVFGAALLKAELYEDNGNWKLDFGEKLSPAESFLCAPQNKKILSDAIYKVWGVGAASREKRSNTPAAQYADAPLPDKGGAAKAKAAREKAADKKDKPVQSQSGADTEMMLKLMGAELLYNKNLREDEHIEERPE